MSKAAKAKIAPAAAELRQGPEAFWDFAKSGEKARVVANLDASAYHAETAFISKHLLDIFADCPAKYAATLRGEIPPADTAALRFGAAFHSAVLEPERFKANYAAAPAEIKVRRGKAWEEFLAANAGKEILTVEEAAKIEAMRAALAAEPRSHALLRVADGVAEQTVLWRAGESGRLAKARIDRVVAVPQLLVDVKTCASAAPAAFARAVLQHRYDVQGAFYVDAMEAATGEEWDFVLVAVEKEPPYAVATYFLSDWEERARLTYRADLERLAECEATGIFPGYEAADNELPVPPWARNVRGGGF